MPLGETSESLYVSDRTDIGGAKIGLNVANPDTLFELATRS
jgi:hypothetical protein